MTTLPQTSFSTQTAEPVANHENWFKTSLAGLVYYHPKVNTDNRGYYAELAHVPDLEAVVGQPFVIKQLNVARSENNVIRGFHAEQWNKLVTVSQGVAFCAIADIRPNSPTFGKVESFLLGRGEGILPGCLFISAGLANSICVVEGPVDYFYAVDQLYRDRDTSNDVAFSLFDPDLAVNWPTNRDTVIISDRDRNSVTLREKFPEKFSNT